MTTTLGDVLREAVANNIDPIVALAAAGFGVLDDDDVGLALESYARFQPVAVESSLLADEPIIAGSEIEESLDFRALSTDVEHVGSASSAPTIAEEIFDPGHDTFTITDDPFRFGTEPEQGVDALTAFETEPESDAIAPSSVDPTEDLWSVTSPDDDLGLGSVSPRDTPAELYEDHHDEA